MNSIYMHFVFSKMLKLEMRKDLLTSHLCNAAQSCCEDAGYRWNVELKTALKSPCFLAHFVGVMLCLVMMMVFISM